MQGHAARISPWATFVAKYHRETAAPKAPRSNSSRQGGDASKNSLGDKVCAALMQCPRPAQRPLQN
eukprot:12509048-Alexandrium_andersonii.AAC.1